MTTIFGPKAKCPECGASIGPSTVRVMSGCKHATLISVPAHEPFTLNSASTEVVIFQGGE